MTEATLRDMIAKDIEVLEQGLVLLSKEQYIPHSLGTKGFIDLYAKDKKGNHVIIELKKVMHPLGKPYMKCLNMLKG